jgi:hypothetical protein
MFLFLIVSNLFAQEPTAFCDRYLRQGNDRALYYGEYWKVDSSGKVNIETANLAKDKVPYKREGDVVTFQFLVGREKKALRMSLQDGKLRTLEFFKYSGDDYTITKNQHDSYKMTFGEINDLCVPLRGEGLDPRFPNDYHPQFDTRLCHALAGTKPVESISDGSPVVALFQKHKVAMQKLQDERGSIPMNATSAFAVKHRRDGLLRTCRQQPGVNEALNDSQLWKADKPGDAVKPAATR